MGNSLISGASLQAAAPGYEIVLLSDNHFLQSVADLLHVTGNTGIFPAILLRLRMSPDLFRFQSTQGFRFDNSSIESRGRQGYPRFAKEERI